MKTPIAEDMVRTIRLEDHGQDFLEWDIDAEGNVVDCRPFQAWVWTDYRVLNHAELEVGSRIEIQREGKEPSFLKYRVQSICEAGRAPNGHADTIVPAPAPHKRPPPLADRCK